MTETLRRLRQGLPEDWPSLALLEFTVALAQMMKANGEMKQKDLAERLGVSPPYISSVMSGNENLTVEQMSRLAEAAGGSLHLTIAPRGLYIRWIEDSVAEAATEMTASLSHYRREMPIPRAAPFAQSQLEMVSRNYGRQAHASTARKIPSAVSVRQPFTKLQSPLGPSPIGQKAISYGG